MREVLVTDAVNGILNPKEFPREAVQFRFLYKLDRSPNIVGIHAAWHPDFWEGMRQLFNSEIDIPERLQRAGATLIMPSIESTIAHAGTLDRKTYVVLHPDSAAYVLYLLENGAISFPQNVTAAIENDDGVKHGKYLKPDCDPRDPQVVRSLANQFAAFGIPTIQILDVEHLLNTYSPQPERRRKFLESTLKILEKIHILHLSGIHHTGYSIPEICEFVEITKPEMIVLEGPVPYWQFFSLQSEVAELKNLVMTLRQRLH